MNAKRGQAATAINWVDAERKQLKSIRVELSKNIKFRHLRNFLDPLYSITHRLINSGGSLDTEMAVGYPTKAVEALVNGQINKIHQLRKEKILEGKQRQRVLSGKEHVVPLSVLQEMLDNLERDENGEPFGPEVKRLLDKFLIVATTTYEEGKLLDKHYKSSMPPEFYDETDPLYMNPWARYIKLGIAVCDENWDLRQSTKELKTVQSPVDMLE
jgi:hypothetical protein